VQIEQDVGLFSCGEGEQARVPGFAGGGGGALEVRPGAGQASARAQASCSRFPGRSEYRRLVSIWPMWASSLPATAGAPRRRSSSRMLSVSPCKTRTTVPSMRPAAVICRSSSASCPELATVLLRGRETVICRGVSPSRTRA
jgi:hypothetical protein